MIPVVPALHALGYEIHGRGDQLHLRWLGEGEPSRALVVPLLLELKRRKAEVLAALIKTHPIEAGPEQPGSRPGPAADNPDAGVPSVQRTRPIEASGRTRGDVTLELPRDLVVEHFLAQQPDEWKRDHLALRFDRGLKAYVVGFTAPALYVLREFVATSATFETAAARDHYAAFLQWRMDQGVAQLTFKPFQTPNVPEVLPGQLSLFD